MARCSTSLSWRPMRSRHIKKRGRNTLAAWFSRSCESQIASYESSPHGKRAGDGVVDAGGAPGEDRGFASGGGVFGVGAGD